MANLLADALLAGQRVQQGQQAIDLNQQKIQQQRMIQGVQADAQSIFDLKNQLQAGATDQDLFTNIQNQIAQRQAAGLDVNNLVDAGNILQSQGREGFAADLQAGEEHLQTFQKAGLIDLPGLAGKRVQSSVAVPGGTRQISSTGQISFTPRSEEERIATARAETEKQLRAKESKLELERGISDVKVKENKLKQLNKDRSAIVKDFRTQSQLAAAQIPTINNTLKKLERISTGSFAEQKAKLKRFFGLDAANEEAFMAETNKLVLNAAEKMKGALSERDLTFLVKSTANIGNTVAGNIQILNDIKKLAEHSIGVNKKLKKFIKGGGKPEDFEPPLLTVTTTGAAVPQQLSPEQKQSRKAQLFEELRKARGQ